MKHTRTPGPRTPGPPTPGQTPVQIPGVAPYAGPAGGWGALGAVARALRGQMATALDAQALLRVNKPDGFDCPGCAWPDPKKHSSFEFCENGAKAVSWEATAKRTTPEFFARHTVSELLGWSDYALENQGRLTHPMAYDAASDRYLPLSWPDAFARIGAILRAIPDPDQVEFYTSGRASNEAAFLYQLFAREYGTNNFPDCSNMCHEATSVGLPQTIGQGKGTVSLEDFDHADAVFCIGHNPGTNHPRMLATLREVSKRGAPIVVFNPLRERGLERFTSPQSPLEMMSQAATPIASSYYQVKVGGDLALLKGLMKALLAREAAGDARAVDRAFIREHTTGFAELEADLLATPWDDIVAVAGLTRAQIEAAAGIYAKADRVILCYGMGVTQHQQGTRTIHHIAHLALMRGNIGREGAGICPLRGHSNVQGDRTVGITEVPSADFLDALERVFGFKPPRHKGHNAVETMEALYHGRARALIALGGNLAVAMPDPVKCFAGMRRLDLAVHIATKLNRSHLLVGGQSLLLPCLGRTEIDMQETGPQSVTVEDSMSMVHASSGTLHPASPALLSEPAIIAHMAEAALPDTKVAWRHLIGDYGRIRDLIEAVFPDFRDFNRRIREPGGFRLSLPAADRVWRTPGGKATFLPFAGVHANPPPPPGALTLATIRSHDQYNTTIYGLNDRYRGIKGRRDVVFVNAQDLADQGLASGDVLDVVGLGKDGAAPPDSPHVLRGVTAVAFDIPRGSVAAYYPEANVLIPLDAFDPASGTPAYKAVPVRLRRAA